jgi:hypothetical protein
MQERHREQATLDALAALTDFLSTAREDRTAVITLTDGWRLFGPNPRLGGMISSNRGGFGGLAAAAVAAAAFLVAGFAARRHDAGRRWRTGRQRCVETECEADRTALAGAR